MKTILEQIQRMQASASTDLTNAKKRIADCLQRDEFLPSNFVEHYDFLIFKVSKLTFLLKEMSQMPDTTHRSMCREFAQTMSSVGMFEPVGVLRARLHLAGINDLLSQV
jgi:hypothetical protein